MIILIKNSSNFRKKSPFESILEIQAQEEDFDHHEDRATKERKQPARTLERNQFLCTVFRGELDKQQVLLPDQPKSVQGCIIRSILPSGMGARGEHGDVFLFSNLGSLWFSENLIRYS